MSLRLLPTLLLYISVPLAFSVCLLLHSALCTVDFLDLMMAESRIEIITEPSDDVRNVVLVGRTGNGKSATSNSILNKKAFKSTTSSVGVTNTCEMETIALESGQILNVIDAPGLFDFSVDTKHASKEIAKCMLLAKNGIHAFILVFSVRTRFTKEEEATIRSLQNIFGPKFVDYTVIVFTGGDDLAENDQTLEDYLGLESPQPLQEIVRLCGNRLVLFNNKADNDSRRAEQVQLLLAMVNVVSKLNKRQPYSNEFFSELKESALPMDDQQKLERMTQMVEQRLGKSIFCLEQQIEEEKAARLKKEQLAQKELEKERAERLQIEERAQQRLAEERAARLKMEQLAHQQLEEARIARECIEKACIEKASVQENAALLKGKELKRQQGKKPWW